MKVKAVLKHINNYIKSKGYSFEKGCVENLYLSLKSKPFVILCGAHGCGKYTLARLFCESIGANRENGRFKFVAIGAGKHSSDFLWGKKNEGGKFVPGELMLFWKRALSDKENPYFLFLDNINFSCPEEYMTEIFTAMDTRYYDESGSLCSEAIFDKDYFLNDDDKNAYGDLGYPENLYIIATVCKAESAFEPGRNIIDRANIIELQTELGLNPDCTKAKAADVLYMDNSFMKPVYLSAEQCPQREYMNIKNDIICEINMTVKHCGNEISYRTRDEMLIYLVLNKEFDLLGDNEATDFVFAQRILPRIKGRGEYIKTALGILFKFCVTNNSEEFSALKMFRSLAASTTKYPKAARKITFMTRSCEENRNCSFWEC